jgi:hypothetical protein
MAEWTQGEQQRAKLLQRKQYEVQLPQREQLMVEWTQGEQQRTKLLLRRQYEVQLLQKEQPMAELLQRKQYEVQLLQKEQPIEGEEEEGEGTCLLLNLVNLYTCI